MSTINSDSVWMPKKKTATLEDGRVVKIRRLPIRAYQEASTAMAAFIEMLSIGEKETGQEFIARITKEGPDKLIELCVIGVEGLNREELLDLDLQTVASLAAAVLAENNIANTLRETLKKAMGQPETAA